MWVLRHRILGALLHTDSSTAAAFPKINTYLTHSSTFPQYKHLCIFCLPKQSSFKFVHSSVLALVVKVLVMETLV